MTSQNCFLSSCSGKNFPVLLAVLSTGLQVGREKVKFNKITEVRVNQQRTKTLRSQGQIQKIQKGAAGTLAAMQIIYTLRTENSLKILQNFTEKVVAAVNSAEPVNLLMDHWLNIFNTRREIFFLLAAMRYPQYKPRKSKLYCLRKVN